VGIPWVKGARGYDACDCVGLVYLYYRDVYGIDLGFLPTRDRESAEQLYNHYSEEYYKRFQEVSKPNTGDIVLIKYRGVPFHMGIVLKPGVMLHAKIKSKSCIERYENYKIEGFYRYVASPE